MTENQHITQGEHGGAVVSGTPLTTSLVTEASPELLLNAIDRRIVKVRPMSTPIEQISRCGGARHADAMRVEYYSVDTKRTLTAVKTAPDSSKFKTDTEAGTVTFDLETDFDDLFEASETILLPGVAGADGQPLVLYVNNRHAGGVNVTAINPVREGAGYAAPVINAGDEVVRMGRAAAELDVQTAQFSAVPVKAHNYCQIFKIQIEQSTLQKIAGKEVGWDFSDQEEAAIIDMRTGMEKNYLFGARAKIYDRVKNQDVYLTGGIWSQAGRDYNFGDRVNEAGLIGLCSTAFTQNAGSKQKILLAGTGLIESISKIAFTRSLSASETVVKWGIEFKEIRSNFGSLLVLHSEIFDQCGHRNDGLVLDPAYVTKFVHMPFRSETLDLRSSGVRNTDAVVLTEASCLVLRYPDAHVRVKA